jgi:hypothetical protein
MGQIKRTGDFSYTTSDTEAFITMYDGPTSTNVSVPTSIEGKPVVSVGDAFKYSEVLGVSLPTGLTQIAASSFFQASLLTNLVIPTGVTNIGSSAFKQCSSLQAVNFPSDQLQQLGSSAFSGCSQLRSIRVPLAVRSLDDSLFSGCTNLTNVTIQGNLDSIRPKVFENCSLLKQLVFQGGVGTLHHTWISGAYRGIFPGSGLTNLIFKKGVGEIGAGSFVNTKELQSLVFEGDVGSLGSYAFQGCDELSQIYFQGKLERIFIQGFAGLQKLQSLVLPQGLTDVSELAFENCTNLKEVIFLSEAPPQNGPAIFRGCPSTLKVKYPQGAVGWANFPNYGNRPTEPTPTVAVISNFPSASPIRLGQPLANSRLTGGTANVGGTFAFENTNTVPPGGISSQPVLFRPDLWYLDELKFDVQVQVLTNIPQVTIPTTLTGAVGRRFFHAVQASDGPNTFTQSGLPAELALGATTGEIGGIPRKAGTSSVEIFASNASTYSGLATFELKVGRGTPEIGTAPTASVLRVGQPLAASRLAGGSATNDLEVVPGKFSWLVGDRKPPAGISQQKVRFAPVDLANHQPTVISIPVTVLGITSDLSPVTLTNGISQTVPYVVQANLAGARFQASGLPPGLKLDPSTGILSGRPSRTGTFRATFSVVHARGDRFSAQKSFTVLPRTAGTYVQQALSFLKSGIPRP